MADVNEIVRTCEYYWRNWERYKQIPSGCYRQSGEKPNFYVCPAQLNANKDEVVQAYERLDAIFSSVRVHSRKRDWAVIDHDAVRGDAAFWTLEHGAGGSEPTTIDDPSKACLAIAIQNERLSTA